MKGYNKLPTLDFNISPVICHNCKCECVDNRCTTCGKFYFPRNGRSPLDMWAARHAPHAYNRLVTLYV